jgi:hypothetical protein
MATITKVLCDACEKEIEMGTEHVSVSVMATRQTDGGGPPVQSREQYEYHLDHTPDAFKPKVQPGEILIDGKVRAQDGSVVKGAPVPAPEGSGKV